MNTQARLKFWQKLLHIQDWEVTVHEKRIGELPCDNCIAATNIDQWHKEATVLLIPVADIPTGRSREHSLVHELLHIVLYPIADGQPPEKVEPIINALAKALMEGK